MPLGSSSATPVMSPGPIRASGCSFRRIQALRNTDIPGGFMPEPAAARGSDRLEISDERQHLILRQVLDHAVHDRRGTRRALNHEHLLEKIRCMLPRQPRKQCEALRMRSVTRGAG